MRILKFLSWSHALGVAAAFVLSLVAARGLAQSATPPATATTAASPRAPAPAVTATAVPTATSTPTSTPTATTPAAPPRAVTPATAPATPARAASATPPRPAAPASAAPLASAPAPSAAPAPSSAAPAPAPVLEAADVAAADTAPPAPIPPPPVPAASTPPVSVVPSAAPPPSSAAPAPSASAAPAPVRKDGTVLLGDDKVFLIRAPRAGKTAEQRAQGASAALTAVSEHVEADDVRVDRRGDVSIVIVGQTPIIQLTQDDAQAAGDASLDVHAASVAASIRTAIERDHRKRALSQTVFSISLLVFLGLIAFYLMQKIGEFGERARTWIDEHAETAFAVRVQSIEVVSPGTVRSTALIALSVARWLAQLGVFYAWLVVGLSLFEATRDYTGKLTGLIVSPLSQLMTRLATGLPVLAVLVLAGFVVFVLVRFIGLFFDSIERRENVVSFVAPDLAAPTGALLRVAVVLGALVYLAPLVTGTTEGTLGRTGAVALVALGLATIPLLASGVLGAIVLFGRRLRAGQHVEIGAHAGRIASIGLLELRLEDADRAEVRIPHLYALRHPTRVLGTRPRVGVDIPVAAADRHAEVQSLLLGVASRFSDDARVELLSADVTRTLFRVTLASDQRNARSELQLAIVEALQHAGVPLGKLGGAAS